MPLKIIKFCFLCLFFFVPLIFTSFNSELFEFTKMIFVYVMAIFICAFWILRMIVEKRIIFKRTFWDFPLIIFFIAVSISTIFSHDVYMSLFGYYSRFHQGLFSLSAFLILYFAFVSNIENDSYGFRADKNGLQEKDNIRNNPLEIRKNPSGYLNKLILTIILSSLIVAIYGIAQHFGLDFFRWVQDVQTRVFSSLGQPNWLGAYLAIALLILFGVLLQNLQNQNSDDNLKLKDKSEKIQLKIKKLIDPYFIFYLLFFILFYACLLFTRSRSAFAAFHISFFILTIILFKKNKKLFMTAYLMFLILINVFNILPTPFEKINEFTIPNIINKISVGAGFSTRPGHRAEGLVGRVERPSSTKNGEGGTESFAIRRIVWKGAWNTFLAHPVFGYGNETFALAYYRYKPIEQNLVSEWDFLYNKAHNEYLNYLATTGAFGFAAYLLLIGAFVVYFIKLCRERITCPEFNEGYGFPTMIINLSLFLAWLTILITNALGFSVVIISLFFYLIPAIIVVLNQNANLKVQNDNVKLKINTNGGSIKQSVFFFLLLLTTYYLLRTTFTWWLADIHFARAQTAATQGEYNLAFQEYTSAIELSPYHPIYHGEFSVTLSEMASYFNSQKERSLTKNLAEKAIDESALAISISKNNPVFTNYQALVFHNLTFIDNKYSQKSVDSILNSYALSPNDPKITYHMAIYFLDNGQINKAMKAFEITEKLKPNYVEAMVNYAQLLSDAGRHDKARQILEKLLKYYPDNPDIAKLIKTYKND